MNSRLAPQYKEVCANNYHSYAYKFAQCLGTLHRGSTFGYASIRRGTHGGAENRVYRQLMSHGPFLLTSQSPYSSIGWIWVAYVQSNQNRL